MAKSFQLHEVVHLDSLRLANSVDIVPCKINQHDMFCSVFLRVEKFVAQLLILCIKKSAMCMPRR